MKRIDVAKQEFLYKEIKEASGLNQTAFQKIRNAEEEKVLAKVSKAKKAAAIQAADDAEDELKPKDTMDMHLFQRCTPRGEYVVINDAFHEYESELGYWRALRDQDVLRSFAKKSSETWSWRGSKGAKYKKYCASQAAASSGLKFARYMLTVTEREMPENKHLRAFQNCTVDMRTGQPVQHAPDHYLTNAIGSDYQPGAECPEVFLEFIRMSYGEEMMPIIRASISMLLDPTAPWGHFIHIIGPSGSGKGVMLRLLQKLFGLECSVGGSGLSEFKTPEERHQLLSGKSLYVVGDLAGYQQDLTIFYDLVDNAPMSGRALFSNSAYSRTWDTRFAIGSVQPLKLDNTSGGWDRRVIPILTQRRGASEHIENIETRLEEQRAGIISWALSMDKAERNRIIRNPGKYSERVAIALRESKIHGDSAASFVDACLEPVPYSSQRVTQETPIGVLYDYYCAYCTAHGLIRKGYPMFVNSLKEIIPNHYRQRRRMRSDETDERDSTGRPPIQKTGWVWIKPVMGVFESPQNEFGEVGKGYICRKNACKEGQLDIFDEWEAKDPPSQPETEEPDEPDEKWIGGDRGVIGVSPNLEPSHTGMDRGDRGDLGISRSSKNYEDF